MKKVLIVWICYWAVYRAGYYMDVTNSVQAQGGYAIGFLSGLLASLLAFGSTKWISTIRHGR